MHCHHEGSYCTSTIFSQSVGYRGFAFKLKLVQYDLLHRFNPEYNYKHTNCDFTSHFQPLWPQS